MKIKTSELTGEALDWAVAQCEGYRVRFLGRPAYCAYVPKGKRSEYKWQPTLNWKQGGPIIERELVTVRPVFHAERLESGADHYRQDGWAAHISSKAFWVTPRPYEGSSPLIAAMRCFVASRLGEEMEVPDELA